MEWAWDELIAPICARTRKAVHLMSVYPLLLTLTLGWHRGLQTLHHERCSHRTINVAMWACAPVAGRRARHRPPSAAA